MDPSAPFAAAARRLLPQATIVVDHWHLVRLANQAVTEVRQRVAREQLGRRGRKADPAWAHRRLLLAAGDRLSPRGLDRLEAVLRRDDPTDEIGAAWGVKERLRQLLAERDPDRIRHNCGCSTTPPRPRICPRPPQTNYERRIVLHVAAKNAA